MATKRPGELNLLNVPMIPTRGVVVYPSMILPISVGQEHSQLAAKNAWESPEKLLFLACQKNTSVSRPEPHDIYEVGTLVTVIKNKKGKNGERQLLIQGKSRARVLSFHKSRPFYQVSLEQLEYIEPVPSLELEREKELCRESLGIYLSSHSDDEHFQLTLEDIENPHKLCDIAASHLNLNYENAQALLSESDPIKRLMLINNYLQNFIAQQKPKKSSSFRYEIAKEPPPRNSSRASFGSQSSPQEDEWIAMMHKIDSKKFPLETKKAVLKQFNRLQRMNPESSEFHLIQQYIECLCDLPWSREEENIPALEEARKILDREHAKLEEVKERILEYLAVYSLTKENLEKPATILCLQGPPGVGKTSLGKAIAQAMNRPFVRVSLGGVKDESSIRGHRRTYVGSMPGRIIQAMKEAQVTNPVLMLDEIDKLTSDMRGDPAAALLEVLDPKQNYKFIDHYLNVPYDLSQVVFIATSNHLEKIPAPLRDRMEIISIDGYSLEEKQEIATQHIFPKQKTLAGLQEHSIEVEPEAVMALISHYTREAGLRGLEQQVAALYRKMAKRHLLGDSVPQKITKDNLQEILGRSRYESLFHQENGIGVCTGLAWTPNGGEVLTLESSYAPGQGFCVTGNLGKIMQESARTALSFLKTHCRDFGIDIEFFDQHEIHLHATSAAIAKDGPSAGVTILLTLCSLILNAPIKKGIALTGEISLKGSVLPVGGIKQKILAAHRAGLEMVFIPWANRGDLKDISAEVLAEIEVKPVQHAMQIIRESILHPRLIFGDIEDLAA